MPPQRRIVTLTTDFGRRDSYVAAMKGVILSIAEDVEIVDISHEIAPQDVMEAAHVLARSAPYFPAGTVHVVVVDPGVGTNRRGIALTHGGQSYVGPDNGLFSLVLEGRSPDAVVELTDESYWRSPSPSATFHGRDIFAPVAAHLARGVALRNVGSLTEAISAMHWALPISDDQGIQGWIVHVDGFGNCITNIDRPSFEERQRGRSFKCYAGNTILEQRVSTYAEVPPGDALLLFNSEDALEVAVNRGNAAELMDIRKGTSVNIVFSDER